MNNHRDRILIIAAGLVCMAVAGSVIAGELEPPVPPGTPTMKPLDLIETRRPITAEMLPLTIEESGTSWYLVHDIKTDGAGITVAANDVTIDLNGFVLEGGTGVGIRDNGTIDPSIENITVRNGTVRGWENQGIRLVHRSSILHVRAMDNGGSGIEVGGESVVIGSIASDNALHGIIASWGSVIRDCVASNNTENGIWGGVSVLIVHNACHNNDRSGIRVGRSCHVRDNVVQSNSVVTENHLSGIWITEGMNRVEGNLLAENRNGITVDGNDNVVIRNSAQNNLDSNYAVNPSSTGNMIGTIRTSLTSAGPWDNLCIGICP